MHTLSKLCLTGLASLACLLSVGAQAAIVTYQYTAVISNITEHDLDNDTYVNLDESTFTGSSIKLNDTVTGVFSFDTAARLGRYQPDPRPGSKKVMYEASASDTMYYRIGSTGYTVANDPALHRRGSYQVHDSPAGQAALDFFHMNLLKSDEQFLYSMGLFFVNDDGTVFQDNAMPSSFDSAQFDYLGMQGSFVRTSDNRMMGFDADITLLERLDTDVPEPASLLLLGVGAAGILTGRRRARRFPAH